jgi:hypothetical protein
MAETTYVDSSFQGWINSNGGQFNATPTQNMYTGNENGLRFNSYAAFFIPSGKYASATLSMNPSAYGAASISQIDIFDVKSFSLLDAINSTHLGTSAFEDLATGAQYGSASLFNTYTTVALNSAFTIDVNNAAASSSDLGHYLLIGFTNKTLNGTSPSGPAGGIYVGGTGLEMAPLLLTLESGVPEPHIWAMMIVGFGLAGTFLRRGRASKVARRSVPGAIGG